MSINLQIVSCLFLLAIISIIIYILRKGRISVKYSLVWLFSCGVLLIFTIFKVFDQEEKVQHQEQSIPTEQGVQSYKSQVQNNMAQLTQRTKTSGTEITYTNEGITSRREQLELRYHNLRMQMSLEDDMQKRVDIQKQIDMVESELESLREIERIRNDQKKKILTF